MDYLLKAKCDALGSVSDITQEIINNIDELYDNSDNKIIVIKKDNVTVTVDLSETKRG